MHRTFSTTCTKTVHKKKVQIKNPDNEPGTKRLFDNVYKSSTRGKKTQVAGRYPDF